MAFFPDNFDATQRAAYILELVSIDTQDGVFRFMLGVDGSFTDTDGNTWIGSRVFKAGDQQQSINGNAPEGEVSMVFNDADGPQLISQVRSLGHEYVAGRNITFFIQPLFSAEQFYAPVVAPIRFNQRIMRSLNFSMTGPQQRSISVSFEGPFELRATSRSFFYTTTDHARLTGSTNPSLQYIPNRRTDEQKLFG